MAKLPLPPAVDKLAKIFPEIHPLPGGTTFARLFFAGGDCPVTWDGFRFFGPTASRFDHQLPDKNNQPLVQDRGIMYLAWGDQSIPTCLAEGFQTSRTIDRFSRDPVLCGFNTHRELKILNLTGVFATTIGASTNIHSGPKPKARKWAQQLYLAYPEIDGLLYCASMYGNHPEIALFERGHKAIPTRPLFHRELKDPILESVLIQTANKIGYGLV